MGLDYISAKYIINNIHLLILGYNNYTTTHRYPYIIIITIRLTVSPTKIMNKKKY